MRSALPLALLAVLALAPLAVAQIPTPPDPSTVVDTACATVGGVAPDVRDQLPVCPRADPAPAQPADPAHEHDHPAAPPATPQDAPALAQDAVEAAQGAAQDPGSAPDRVAGFVATLIQFVKDLLHLPVMAAASVGHGLGAAGQAIAHAADATKGAAVSAAGAVKGAAGHALDAVRSLLPPAHETGAKAPAKLGQLPSAAPRAKLPLDLKATLRAAQP